MSTQKIKENQPYLNIPKSGYGLNSTGDKPNNTINSMGTIIYGNKLFHDDTYNIFQSYELFKDSVSTPIGLTHRVNLIKDNKTINLKNTFGLSEGMRVSGLGLPVNTQIEAVNKNSSIIISNKPTKTIISSLTFYPKKITSRTLGPYYPLYNNSKNITITNTVQAFKDNHYNFYTGSFSNGYPKNTAYSFCSEKLTTSWTNYNFNFKNRYVTNDTGLPIQVTSETIGNNTLIANCGGSNPNPDPDPDLDPRPCRTICNPGFILDPQSCLCVPPELCVPQDDCEPIFLPSNIKNTIYGYIYYTSVPREINVPEIGKQFTICGGGHQCCRTKFLPTLISGDTKIIADRTVCLDNYAACNPHNPQIPDGWEPIDYLERADSFTFTVDDLNLLQNARIYLDCQLPNKNCHDSVSMVFLVAHDADTDEPILIFSSCLLPGDTHLKAIGTIACKNNPEDAIPCDERPRCKYRDLSGTYIFDRTINGVNQLLESSNSDVENGSFIFHLSADYMDIRIYSKSTTSFIWIRLRPPLRWRRVYKDWTFNEYVELYGIHNTLTEFVRVVNCCNTNGEIITN